LTPDRIWQQSPHADRTLVNIWMTEFLLAAATTAGDSGFSAAQSLTTLLTTESLLFAAFNAGVVLTAPSTTGRRITPQHAYWLAMGCVAVLGAVAAAGALAWWQVFGDDWPSSTFRAIEGLGIAVGILAQPIVATIIARSYRPIPRP
jgi:hypothetical protein